VISFRNYVVTLLAVFLALAAGVALGGGPLSDLGRDKEPAPAAATSPAHASTYGDSFAGAVASRLYANGLANRQVAVVTGPGVDDSLTTALTKQIAAAGGRVSGTYAIESQLVDPEQNSLVDTLGSQLSTQLKGAVDKGLSTYPRVGQLLGVAVATTQKSPRQPNGRVAAVRQSLVAAKLLTVPRQGVRTAPLVLVVLGDELNQTIADGLMQGLAAKARGVVVVADTGSAGLAGLGTDGVTKQVATVDGVETTAGQVSAVCALIRSWKTPGGSFGASGTDGVVPLG
jgi:Copper transport outer membrane protein, MctB